MGECNGIAVDYCNRKEAAQYLKITMSNFANMVANKMVVADKVTGKKMFFSKRLLDRIAVSQKEHLDKCRERAGMRYEMERPKPDDILYREQLHGLPMVDDDADRPRNYNGQPKYVYEHTCANCRFLQDRSRYLYPLCSKFNIEIEKDNLSQCGCAKCDPIKRQANKTAFWNWKLKHATK